MTDPELNFATAAQRIQGAIRDRIRVFRANGYREQRQKITFLPGAKFSVCSII